jgi:ATP-binding protein involved in chromosome partitioning
VKKSKNYLSMFAFKKTIQLLHNNPLGIPNKGPDAIPSRAARGLPTPSSIPTVKNIVVVSSAKGGVGKSTTSVNLSVALASQGFSTGLLDADLFGPSIPRMMNLNGEPLLSSKNKLLPLTNHGVKCMSMGFLIDQNQPVVWRGLMVMKAIQQLIWDVEWENIDVLVIDLPPGALC